MLPETQNDSKTVQVGNGMGQADSSNISRKLHWTSSTLPQIEPAVSSHPQWLHVMKVDLSQSIQQMWLWGGVAVQHPELFNAMLG